MAEPISIQQLKDASLDVKSLEEVVNGDENVVVTTRLGETYPSVKGSIKELFQNGGLPATPFATKALMTASALVDGKYAMVTDDTVNNGLYVKTAGAWVKSAYDPLTLAKADATAKANDAITTAGTNADNTINSIIKELVTYSENLFDDSKKTTGFAISESGELSPNTNYFVSDYIRINNGDTVYYTTADERNIQRFAYYDINKELISTKTVPFMTANSVVAPANAFYVRVSFNKVGYDINQTMISTSPITAFEPYTLPVATGLSLGDNMKADVKTIAETTTIDIVSNTLGEYVKESNNLLSLTEIEEGYSISTSGVKEVNSSYGIHPFIQVTPNEKYLLSSENRYAVRSIAFYDYKKEFMNRSDVFFGEGDTSRIITIPAGAVYIKPLVTLSAYRPVNQPMLVKGETPIPYEPKKSAELVNVVIGEDALPDSLRGLPKNLKTLDTTRITRFLDKNVELPTNLFDPSTITPSYIYDAAGNFIDSGNTSWFISDFIVVEPLLTYTASNNSPTSLSGGFFKYINHFDADKKFIRRVETVTTDNNPLSLIIPEGVSYIRLTSFHNVNHADRVFEKGSEASGDSSIITRLVGVELDEGFYEDFRKPYFYDTNFNKTYETTRDLTKYAAISSKTSAEVYADFDALMAQNSDYITKETLQPSVLGEEIAAYILKPPHFIDGLSSSALVDTKPTVLIMCGTHGHEHLPITSAHALVSELCNEWKQDDILSALRFNVRFIIVPIANPDGWRGNPAVDGVVRGRKNANGVDIARNFPSTYWGAFTDPEHNMYAGPSPASEPETQNIVQLLEDNKVDIFYDFHNFKTAAVDGSPATTAWILMHPRANTLRVARTVRRFFSKQTRLMNKQFDNIPVSWRAGYTDMFSQGAPMEYAAETGVTLSTTLELNRAVPDFDLDGVIDEDYDAVHSKVTFEAFVNYITTCVDEVRYKY